MFAELPDLAPIRPGEGFPDHEAPRVLHVLPQGLAAAREADGTPRFALSRFRDTAIGAAGGMMHLELDLATLDPTLLGAAAVDGWALRLVGFTAARARLRSHVPGFPDIDSPEAWKPARLSSRTLTVERHLFDVRTVQMLDALLSSDAGDIEVEVEARYEGLEVPMPVLVSTDLDALAALFRPTAEGLTQDQIEAAILSAPTDTGSSFRLERLEGEVLTDGPTLRRLLALAIRGDVFTAIAADGAWAEPRYHWRSDLPSEGRRAWDLSVYRRSVRTWHGRWSLRGFLGGLEPSERAALFPAFSAITPFSVVPVTLIAPVGLDPRFVRRVQVDVLASGPGGVPQQRSFLYPPTPAFHRFPVTYPALTDDFHLSAHVAATLAPLAGAVPALPRPLGRRPLDAGSAVAWTAEDAGFETLAISAMPGLFERASRIEVSVAEGGEPLCLAVLMREAPEAGLAWPVRPTRPTLRVVALRDAVDGPAVTIHTAVAEGALLLRPDMLDVLEPDLVLVSLDPATAGNAAYVAVTLHDPTGRQRSFSLEAGETVEWRCWAASRFDRLTYEYRLQHIPRLPDGTTRPLVTGAWLQAGETVLKVVLPLAEDQP
jgi:hypothetical protein